MGEIRVLSNRRNLQKTLICWKSNGTRQFPGNISQNLGQPFELNDLNRKVSKMYIYLKDLSAPVRPAQIG